MVKPAHNLMTYNSQIVVDNKHKLIVATDITSQKNDAKQLHNMAKATKDNLKLDINDNLEIVGDTGYYSSKELKKCVDDNINAYIPESNITKAQKDKGKFTRDKFKYNKDKNCCICPSNIMLNKSLKPQIKNDKASYIYRVPNASCNNCIPIKDQTCDLK